MDGVNELIERLAREAGFDADPRRRLWHEPDGDGAVSQAALHRFAAAVAEECARMVDEDEPGVGLGNAIRAKFPAMK